MYWIRSFFRGIFEFLTSPLLWAFLGLVCFFLLIWVLGPLISVGGSRPFESEFARLALMACVVFTVVSLTVWQRRRARLAAGALESHILARQGSVAQGPDSQNDAARALEHRFQQALTVLKQARLGRPIGKGVARWWNDYRAANYLYDVPWYIIVGAPGTGKTTALLNSGLKFPLAERMGVERIQGIGGTRNCDWLFTDRAILVDTAGRYTTHTSDRSADGEEWGAFLDLLSQHRPRQPINGVLITISVQELLQGGVAEIELQAMAVRARLQELRDRIKIEFPVYLLITKLDLVAGFGEFFGDLSEDEKKQVWGATFPLKAPDVQDSYDDMFEREYDALMRLLGDRVLDLMEPERDARRRGRSYLFPQHLESIREPLKAFLRGTFVASPYEKPVLFRGFYFTSGTQEGVPISPSFQQLAAPLGLHPQPLQQAVGGRSYFITQMLNDVVFSEAGLAGTNRAWFRRRAILSGAGYALITFCTVALLIGWGLSYVRNIAYVEAVHQRVPAVRAQVESVNTSRESSLNESLPALQSVAQVAHANGVDRESVPVGMRLGLFQGDKLLAASDDAYFRLLQDTLLPRIIFRLEEVLRDPAADAEDKYAALRTYIMVNQPDRYDGDRVTEWVLADWALNLAGDVTVEQRERLALHLKNLVTRRVISSPLLFDEALVNDVRRQISATSLSERIYKQMKRAGIGAKLPAFNIADVAGPGAMLVFERASKKPLSEGVPGIFSLRGYYQVFLKEVDAATVTTSRDYNWVMGIETAKSPDGKDLLYAGEKLEALIRDVKKLYLMEYGNAWAAFLEDLRIKPFGSMEQGIQSVRVLAASDSPIKLLLAAVVREVSLTQIAPEDKTLLQMVNDSLRERTSRFAQLLGRNSPTLDQKVEASYRVERMVDDRFEALRRLVRGAHGAPPQLDASMSLLNEFYNYQMSASTAIKSGMAPPQTDLPTRIRGEAARQPEPLNSLMKSIVGKVEQTTSIDAHAVIGTAMTSVVHDFCAKAISNRYPFVRSSATDVSPDDFVKLFGAGGVMDDFFQKNLAQYTDMSKPTWTFRQTGDAKVITGGEALPLFQKAAVIRDVFLKGGPPTVRIELKPVDMDPQLLQIIIDVDGQIVKYAHGPQIPVTVSWPGTRGSNQVRIQYSVQGSTETVSKVFEGPWALFRALDAAQISPGATPERLQASFGAAGAQARFEVNAMGVRNPFRLPELQSFRCPARL